MVIRLKIWEISKSIVQKTLNLLKDTKYQRVVDDSLAPATTSCVSFVRFFLKEITENKIILPKYYIGNMPKLLLKKEEFQSKVQKVEEAQIGDLVFFYWYSLAHKAEMIRHIGVVTDDDFHFHHSLYTNDGNGGMREGNLFHSKWHINLATQEQIIASRDPRTKVDFHDEIGTIKPI